jgi:hypothetical protein
VQLSVVQGSPTSLAHDGSSQLTPRSPNRRTSRHAPAVDVERRICGGETALDQGAGGGLPSRRRCSCRDVVLGEGAGWCRSRAW